MLAEQGRFGGISIGGSECRESKVGGVDERLGLLNERLKHHAKREGSDLNETMGLEWLVEQSCRVPVSKLR